MRFKATRDPGNIKKKMRMPVVFFFTFVTSPTSTPRELRPAQQTVVPLQHSNGSIAGRVGCGDRLQERANTRGLSAFVPPPLPKGKKKKRNSYFWFLQLTVSHISVFFFPLFGCSFGHRHTKKIVRRSAPVGPFSLE